MDMSEKTDKQIQNLIENHRRAGKLDAPLAVAAIAEQGRRNKVFNFKAGIEFLLQAAHDKRPVNYRQLAEAGGVLNAAPGDQELLAMHTFLQYVFYVSFFSMSDGA